MFHESVWSITCQGGDSNPKGTRIWCVLMTITLLVKILWCILNYESAPVSFLRSVFFFSPFFSTQWTSTYLPKLSSNIHSLIKSFPNLCGYFFTLCSYSFPYMPMMQHLLPNTVFIYMYFYFSIEFSKGKEYLISG